MMSLVGVPRQKELLMVTWELWLIITTAKKYICKQESETKNQPQKFLMNKAGLLLVWNLESVIDSIDKFTVYS